MKQAVQNNRTDDESISGTAHQTSNIDEKIVLHPFVHTIASFCLFMIRLMIHNLISPINLFA